MTTTLELETTATTSRRAQRRAERLRFAGWAALDVGVWLLAAVVTTSNHYAVLRARERTEPWGALFTYHALAWSAWVVITWLVFWMAHRLPLERGRVGAHVARFLGLGVVWILLQTAWSAAIPVLLGWMPASRYLEELRAHFGFYLVVDVILYVALVITAYAALYYGRFQRERRRAAELSEQVTQAELQALRAQLQPHFLFNTLNSIAGLIRTGERESSLRVLALLSDLLRSSLESHRQPWLDLDQELDLIDRYLEIQKVRFSDTLQVTIDVDPRCRRAQVPAMVLQPLVENAIRHGATAAGARIVEISAARRADTLLLEICNPCDGDLTASSNEGHGIGLDNTRARLARHFGEGFVLRLERRRDGTVCTHLRLPFLEEAP